MGNTPGTTIEGKCSACQLICRTESHLTRTRGEGGVTSHVTAAANTDEENAYSNRHFLRQCIRGRARLEGNMEGPAPDGRRGPPYPRGFSFKATGWVILDIQGISGWKRPFHVLERFIKTSTKTLGRCPVERQRRHGERNSKALHTFRFSVVGETLHIRRVRAGLLSKLRWQHCHGKLSRAICVLGSSTLTAECRSFGTNARYWRKASSS